ncbi:MAG: zf-HC2 domain-containing protein [Desulfobacter sp.]|nr:MAG: zf-HC2 domain-containing protein [Desulfobacter sp.]
MAACDKYSTEFISRFVDNEVSKQDHDAFVRHTAGCRACAQTEVKFRQMAKTFDRHARSGAAHIQSQLPPIILEQKPKKTVKILSGFKRPMGIGLRLASIGAAALILMLAVYPWSKTPGPGPSAIVNSVDTYGSSVMIIESANAHHTIIWFSET